jgi:L-lactate permease
MSPIPRLLWLDTVIFFSSVFINHSLHECSLLSSFSAIEETEVRIAREILYLTSVIGIAYVVREAVYFCMEKIAPKTSME